MDYKKKFYDISSLIQQEFDRNLGLYGDKIKCGKGCSKCCSQIFRITALDGWIITEHIKSLPEEERERLIANANKYIERQMLETANSRDKKKEISSLHTEASAQVCPALGTEGECTIYEARPIVCRRFGAPIYDYKNPDNVYACDLNFKAGEEITDPLLIPNQTKIGKMWDEAKREFGEGATTIAEAIASAGMK